MCVSRNVLGLAARGSLLAAAALALGIATSGCISSRCHPVQVAPGILDGCKPRTQEDFDSLREQGVRTIVSLETLPWNIWPERRLAQKNGLNYTNVPIVASPFEPSEKRVKQALLALRDQSLQPVFLHCYLGEDRDVFIVGLYRMYYQAWSPEAAWQEMLNSNFHVRMSLRGFQTYFWSHTVVPDWIPKNDGS
jgi:hypothetical protein